MDVLPCEIIEHVCSYLSCEDVLRLEQTCKGMRASILKAGSWKRLAVRIVSGLNHPSVGELLLKYVREKKITDQEYFKTVAMIMTLIRKCVGAFTFEEIDFTKVCDAQYQGNRWYSTFDKYRLDRCFSIVAKERMLMSKFHGFVACTNNQGLESLFLIRSRCLELMRLNAEVPKEELQHCNEIRRNIYYFMLSKKIDSAPFFNFNLVN